jgi:uncharacterized OB-fold protein/acyl dehydratase
MSLQGKAREEFEKKLEAFVGVETGPPQVAPDRVNETMIRHWCHVLADENPAYTDPEAAARSVHGGLVAPPTMLQSWILAGYDMALGKEEPGDKQNELHRLFDEHGYTGVVATNCEQEYTRYLRPGNQVVATTVIEDISEQKATALGIGYFINTRTTFRDEKGEDVGWMTFRVLKFESSQQPQAEESGGAAMPAKPKRMRPTLGHDNQWWWEGCDRGEILIQKCSSCGKLRHPARPICCHCQSLEWESIVARGKGTIYSYVVMHYPEIPGYDYPLAVGVIELEEGTRLVANIEGIDHDKLEIGMAVQGAIEAVDDELNLPIFRPAS